MQLKPSLAGSKPFSLAKKEPKPVKDEVEEDVIQDEIKEDVKQEVKEEVKVEMIKPTEEEKKSPP